NFGFVWRAFACCTGGGGLACLATKTTYHVTDVLHFFEHFCVLGGRAWDARLRPEPCSRWPDRVAFSVGPLRPHLHKLAHKNARPGTLGERNMPSRRRRKRSRRLAEKAALRGDRSRPSIRGAGGQLRGDWENLSRGDLLLFRKAIKEDWPVPP